MPYMLLVMEPAGQREARPVPDGKVLFDRMAQFGENLKARGIGKFTTCSGRPRKACASRCATASAAWSTDRLRRRRRSSAASSARLLEGAGARGRRRVPGRRVRHHRGARSRAVLGAIAHPRPAKNNPFQGGGSPKIFARCRSSRYSFRRDPQRRNSSALQARGKHMRFMAIVKPGKDYEAGKPPSPELMAAMGKLLRGASRSSASSSWVAGCFRARRAIGSACRAARSPSRTGPSPRPRK